MIILAMYARVAFSADSTYTGELSFRADTNISKMSMQGKTRNFKTLDINFKDTKPQRLTIVAVVDTSTILSTIYFNNYEVYKNNFLSKENRNAPTFLKMKLTNAACTPFKKGFECTGSGEFMLSKAGFTKIIKIILDEKLNALSVFTLSQKELNLKPHNFVGVEIDDQVKVYLYAFHK
ncbi:MAG: hypothetical protein H7336_17435 [Bacteriovorax sp.]|nr:hypothetical protein [Bacteriovorax sp.]